MNNTITHEVVFDYQIQYDNRQQMQDNAVFFTEPQCTIRKFSQTSLYSILAVENYSQISYLSFFTTLRPKFTRFKRSLLTTGLHPYKHLTCKHQQTCPYAILAILRVTFGGCVRRQARLALCGGGQQINS